MRAPVLYLSQILAWADAYQRRKGRWPAILSGPILGSPHESWRKVDNALRYGLRGLPGGSSLACFLAEQRGARNLSRLPPLTVGQILRWADSYHGRTGNWPTETSGPITDAPGETWYAVDRALRAGVRGLKGESSLPQLLAKRRGVRNVQALPALTVRQILAWADAHHRRRGVWPTRLSGPIPDAPGETWTGVDAALQRGGRGLGGTTSLARLLVRRRQVHNPKLPPRLAVSQILRWADGHYRRTRRWPTATSGPVLDAPGETWAMIDRALREGKRGLRAGSSLSRLLKKHGRAGGRLPSHR